MKLNEQIDLFGETESAQPKNNLAADELCAKHKLHILIATEEDARRFRALIERATGQKINSDTRTVWWSNPPKKGRS
jgi:hypothetical protein